jgi:hypothetical protein
MPGKQASRELTFRLLTAGRWNDLVALFGERGARVIEAYPVDSRTRRADMSVYTGLASTFRELGFTEVARRSPTRPIMRLALR